MIAINFEDTYEHTSLASDYSRMTFNSPQVKGTSESLLVKIESNPNPLLPGVYNLGFGPSDGNDGFRDDVRLRHAENNKVFSTVLFHGLNFLHENPEFVLGIDGSDDVRATMYHLMFKTNREYLTDIFIAIGVDWYVRVFRNWTCEIDGVGNLLPKPKPELFDYDRSRHDLYRYYMFRLK